ncbi:hypothetical protein [Methyloglobulus morosus]|uniref:hypothetical protein n=1 Tax=Methyloglobulus morosus TaxID=1410681 RepID=UPI00040747D8|nr:hypothetical protein [Methyloglobulus morosus]
MLKLSIAVRCAVTSRFWFLKRKMADYATPKEQQSIKVWWYCVANPPYNTKEF